MTQGTRDFYPEDMRLRNWLFDHFRKSSMLFGFEEYDSSVVEHEDLFIRKAGEEVTEQLYNFLDKGDRRLSLRPEMTPSLARMILQRKNALPFPLKWYSIPQCWRYEHTTRGRRREHYQWNMDVWGVSGVEAEAEVLAAAVQAMRGMGLGPSDVGIKINSRKLLNDVMSTLSIPSEKWAQTFVLVDKLEKVPLSAMTNDLHALGLTEGVVKELLDCMKFKSLEQFEQRLGSGAEGLSDLRALFSLARDLGIEEWLVFDASVVRGLAYYTGLVFEGFDRKGELRAIFGGGRYDRLLCSLDPSSPPLPAVGFGFGDAVIIELLKSKKLLPDLSTSRSVQALVFPLCPPSNPELFPLLRSLAARTASQLRQAGVSVDLVLEDKKPKWAFQRSNRLGAAATVIISADSPSSSSPLSPPTSALPSSPDFPVPLVVSVKDMVTGEQRVVLRHSEEEKDVEGGGNNVDEEGEGQVVQAVRSILFPSS